MATSVISLVVMIADSNTYTELYFSCNVISTIKQKERRDKCVIKFLVWDDANICDLIKFPAHSYWGFEANRDGIGFEKAANITTNTGAIQDNAMIAVM